ncbi:hypothetical protein EGR_10866 [Echinococcus granulosus]|uniref:Uncharacterized protein n=1 Tax=Echinococcus granulosus TaxID=6210 RepID=W6UL84_ECHGR|nr:hypothetical protein EGR_10866 [Echinococcus granulosus]EUB54274.1 hypothetical protein EGR_10866 [Echinococcus granulosus]
MNVIYNEQNLESRSWSTQLLLTLKNTSIVDNLSMLINYDGDGWRVGIESGECARFLTFVKGGFEKKFSKGRKGKYALVLSCLRLQLILLTKAEQCPLSNAIPQSNWFISLLHPRVLSGQFIFHLFYGESCSKNSARDFKIFHLANRRFCINLNFHVPNSCP